VLDLIVIGAGRAASHWRPSHWLLAWIFAVLVLERAHAHSAIRQLYPEQKLATRTNKGSRPLRRDLCLEDLTRPGVLD